MVRTGTPIAVERSMVERSAHGLGTAGIHLCVVVLVSALAVACGGTESANPAAPTPPGATTVPPSSPPPPPSGCPVPNTPSGLTVSSIASRVTLSWSPVANIRDYELIIGTGPANSDILFTNTTLPTYNWTGGAVGSYYARVGARNSCGSSPTSNPVAFAITP